MAMLYKRNQIEEAISAVLEPRASEPSAELRTRVKRLLEADRALGRDPRSNDPGCAVYAFFSVEAPGSGVEVWFSGYEGFALLNGLRLMSHGWPQGFVIVVLRQVRPELERQHVRILKQDPKWLFDQEAIRRAARAGDIAFDNRDPVLLTIVSKSEAVEIQPHQFAICRGPDEATRFAWKAGKGLGAWTMFELASIAHRLTNELERTEPRHRGRSG